MVAKVNSVAVGNTSEGGGLDLPVVDWVIEQADAVIERLLHAKASGAEVIYPHLADVVGVKVHHLKTE